MPDLNITVLQETLHWLDGAANLRHFDGLLAGLTGRDVILLPEMFTTGFAMEAARASLPESEVVAWLHGHAQATDALVGGSAAVETAHGAVNRFLLVEPGGTVHRYDKRHLFRMAGEHRHYAPGEIREVFTWRGWRILPQICYDLRFPVFSRNQNDYDLALYVANWPAARAAHWQALLLARAIENQAYVVGGNRVGEDGNGHRYSGDSRIVSPQGELLAVGEPFARARLDATLRLDELQAYRERFPAWQDADAYTLGPTPTPTPDR